MCVHHQVWQLPTPLEILGMGCYASLPPAKHQELLEGGGALARSLLALLRSHVWQVG